MTKLIVLAGAVVSLLLSSCAKTNHDAPAELSDNNKVKSEIAEQVHSNTVSTLNHSCANLDLNTLIGFTEGTVEASCQPVRDFHLKQFKCSVSQNAFGAELDAIVLKTDQLSVFAYASSKDCQHAVEIRNANE
ncbi:hypothetical protein [Alkanindiges illinoisensis]|uniref:Lipoprotein n=1 Tax=Alkanindiges illinoisensis TaxID=197183 RepID=A0A4Y7XBA1_9GAMM|nr:hypothetical protein [Alkanindiges illinoisensis]TEU25593.1 hypothetical protein E2B99_09525 [Alkanindiges illinoisensis]